MSPTSAPPLPELDLARPTAATQGSARGPRPLDGWEERAACRVVVTSPDSDVFYGPDGERHPMTARREKTAKRICKRCPVRQACLLQALTTREPYGIWGGYTAEERRGLLATGGTHLPRHPGRTSVGSGW